MKPKSASKNLFFTEVNSNHNNRSLSTTNKNILTSSSIHSNLNGMNTTLSKANERPKSRQTGHVSTNQIKQTKMKVLDYMINDGTQFANLEKIEEFYKENNCENNNKYDFLSSDINRKKDQIKKLDELIKNV